ncbi:hypothetical protein PHYSODRAFT_298037 [Phytophthora sojae]|uniref:Uncharacterized protein n=1 Tax=Phytophthora sojae (strain P6497) TaxID=1094619 RepID=G4Z5R9_PHYSP|nr:hypothetical protein PHYSODRAFT_298037 [Phytophthora sojae]EGZ19502.1 hypothetical protein PHYSODRAFT_298037 [Phytophthora sojae]|eukprot:XP_009522219.1 hypothetical protein PHYSODRAFT_298037 [Phytophthora sojae]
MFDGYPVYQVLVTKVNHTLYELPVLLILPMLKFVLKLLFIPATIHKEEMMPEQVVFTVNFFDMLYLATFMQSISSTTMAVIMAIDLFHSAVSLLSLHKKSQEISAKIRQVFGTDVPVAEPFDLLTSIRSLCSHPQLFFKQMHPCIRVWASMPHQLSPEARDVLERIEKQLLYNSAKRNSLTSS